MSVYFQGFPTIQYDIDDDRHFIEVVDIFRTVRPKKSLKDDLLLYSKYTIKDGERPDHVSQKLYGSTDYYWTFFMVNEKLVNYHTDWPQSRQELEDYIAVKYDGYALTVENDISTLFTKNETIQGLISGATATITQKDCNTDTIRIKNVVGEFRANELIRGLTSEDVVRITGQIPFADATHHYEGPNSTITDKNNGIPITYSEYEFNLNEEKAELKIIRPEYIMRVSEQFFQQINPTAE
jgi:hypothetical protein